MCYRERRLEDSHSFKVTSLRELTRVSSILLSRLYLFTPLSNRSNYMFEDTVKCSGRGILKCFINAALKRQVLHFFFNWLPLSCYALGIVWFVLKSFLKGRGRTCAGIWGEWNRSVCWLGQQLCAEVSKIIIITVKTLDLWLEVVTCSYAYGDT